MGKEEVKQSLFAHDKIVYKENSMESTKQFLELISEFSKVRGIKLTCEN